MEYNSNINTFQNMIIKKRDPSLNYEKKLYTSSNIVIWKIY